MKCAGQADTFSLFDQGTHNLTPGDGANGLNNWMSSIAQDNRGDIALGFSQAGTTQRADIKIAGRTNNIANSGMLNEGEALMYAATGSQTSTSNRWGDYSSMSIDPTDDCTFWYTQEYYATTSSGGLVNPRRQIPLSAMHRCAKSNNFGNNYILLRRRAGSQCFYQCNRRI